jgi:hypothetical protein
LAFFGKLPVILPERNPLEHGLLYSPEFPDYFQVHFKTWDILKIGHLKANATGLKNWATL